MVIVVATVVVVAVGVVVVVLLFLSSCKSKHYILKTKGFTKNICDSIDPVMTLFIIKTICLNKFGIVETKGNFQCTNNIINVSI